VDEEEEYEDDHFEEEDDEEDFDDRTDFLTDMDSLMYSSNMARETMNLQLD